MIIKVLDRGALGEDTPLDGLYRFGDVTVFQSTSAEELKERCVDADILIINKVKITDEIFSLAKNLKLICIFATGFDNIDIQSAKKHGVAVCNVPGYSTDSVALFTLSTTLALFSHLKEYSSYVTSGEYTKSGVANRLVPVYHELKGKTWGIIGYGNIGRAVGKVAKALGANLIVNKVHPEADAEVVSIEELCKRSDIITIHCPLNDSTRGLINKEKIALMKDNVIIVNEARGAVVNDEDLTDAILNKRIAAFGCDVYSQEPFSQNHPFNKIMKLDNVILTPHAAWGAYEARERCINIICDNISKFLNGKIQNRVDK